MEDLLRPLFGYGPQFQLRRAAGKLEFENAALGLHLSHVFEQHLEPFAAAKEQMVGFQIGLTGQGLLLVTDFALYFLSHIYASIATGSPNLAPRSRRDVSMLPP